MDAITGRDPGDENEPKAFRNAETGRYAHACPDLDQEFPEQFVRCNACHADHRLGEECPKGARNAYTPAFIPLPFVIEKQPRLKGDAAERKNAPMCRGLLDYFPNACAAVAELSRIGNEQHNPGEPMHWARGKSNDQEDCIVRHLVDRGTVDTDGVRHSTKVAWRALALLQLELEEAGEA